ncbi:fungal-specific transcription factor domain-containing protein [Emericellopsis atlantica]|uniref:Fungal-specific transcription factor domain-containing protein n=1 Tax=Emericellopsis atlantica TaxID=2614577 RepID=A0A9P8CS22_9HYPO|nr:fungal-specific transcription factor domain-containing protein [Emericellopsis atlantica]KAG9256932.1 fungal-specific transcription factor domain-containing protein [Emericellopsis atlantica]
MSSLEPQAVPERLPVNPRRRKVAAGDRKRVPVACNHCNSRRKKCSGQRPCRLCQSAGRECVYPSQRESSSGTVAAELEQLRQRCAALEVALADATSTSEDRQPLLSHHSHVRLGTPPPVVSEAAPAAACAGTPSTPPDATEGRMLHDPDGTVRFLGETSGATFLDYLKEFMTSLFPLAPEEPWAASPDWASLPDTGVRFIWSVGRYQTHDSRPLSEPEVDPMWLPTRTEMILLLAELRYAIQDGNGDFPSGGIYWWGDLETLPVPGPGESGLHSNEQLALYQAAFAMACQTRTASLRGADARKAAEAHSQRARMLLGNPLKMPRNPAVRMSTLALMAFYLIEVNRRDAAYACVSMAIHIAVTHGFLRGWVDEPGKRLCWTLYILDRWLSCLMGRPPTIHDDAVRMALPVEVASLPPAAGLIAHVELARISGYIVCNTYRVAPWRGASTQNKAPQHCVDEAAQMLQSWQDSLPLPLRMDSVSFNRDPAVCILQMSFHQLVVLTARPIFFIAVKKAVAERCIQPGGIPWSPEGHPRRHHIEAGLASAGWNLRIARWLVQLDASRRFAHAELHYVFNAAIIRVLEDLARESLPVPDPDVTFALELLKSDAESGSSYSRDCWVVLTGLAGLVQAFNAMGRARQSLSDQMGLFPGEQSGAAFDGMHHPAGSGSVTVQDDLQLFQLSQGDTLYRELVGWMEMDDYSLYHNFDT